MFSDTLTGYYNSLDDLVNMFGNLLIVNEKYLYFSAGEATPLEAVDANSIPAILK